MAKFVFAYRGGAAANSAQEQEAMIAEWEAWFASLGSAVLDRGNPFGSSISLISEEYDGSDDESDDDESEESDEDSDNVERDGDERDGDERDGDEHDGDERDDSHTHSENCDHDHDHDHDGDYDAELEKYLLTGFSIIEARDLEEAANLARGCPALENGGAVDVYETL